MPASEARVRTDRAGRYLAQLCNHGSQMSREATHPPRGHGGDAPPAVRHADATDTDGLIDFDGGRCTLRATAEALTLTAEADDPQNLQRIQDGIARRLERIGRRDRLTVTWQQPPPDAASGEPADEPASAAAILDVLMAPEGRADPFPLYARAHEIGPVSAIADGAFLVSGCAAVNQVLRDPGFGLPEPSGVSSADGELLSLARSILRANPPDHGRMRALIGQVFTPRRVAALQPVIEDAVDVLLDRLAYAGTGGRTADFMDQFAYQLPVTVICELLGVPASDHDKFRPLAADLTEALELSADTDLGPAAAAAARELTGYFTDMIAERRVSPRDDLIGALVAARDADDGRLTESELLANLVVLLVAGFETTTNLLGNGLAILLEHPELAAALRSGTVEISGFVEEVLRFDSPVQVTTRVAREENLHVARLPIPPGSVLILLIGAANRDPDRYCEPDSFDPTRTDVKPLSFGAGAHFCLGNGLARLEAAVAFPRLLARFPALTTAPGQHPVRRDRLVLRGYQSLPIRIADDYGRGVGS